MGGGRQDRRVLRRAGRGIPDDPGSNTNGGLYEQVAPGVMFEGFNDWIFADGRAIGDTGLVENPRTASRAGTSSTWRAGTTRLEAHRQERADQREAGTPGWRA